LNAYLVDTTTALSANPTFRGAVLNDPKGKVHLVDQLASYDYTDVEIGPDGLARAAYPFGLVGNLANLTPAAAPAERSPVTQPSAGQAQGRLPATGLPFAVTALGALLVGVALRLRRFAANR
jgi:hypothetical protein